MMTQLINPQMFTQVTTALRSFFLSKGFHEVHTQNRLSILAACEDPTTVATYHYANEIWPLPQTGQMWLEYELLSNPSAKGFFCVSTSYREEKNPIEGRHDLIFPMFEFEMPGEIADLFKLECQLIKHLGWKNDPDARDYEEWCKQYDVEELTDREENQMPDPAMILNFPNKTSPFWNMKQNGDETAAKIDVILGGMETIGSAERSSDPEEMRDSFYSISDGAYANLLHELFGKDRVDKELDEFLMHSFIPRVGGGIGLTRLISAIDRL
jgi:aspartyl/asparaginyl-tRNA synthetase